MERILNMERNELLGYGEWMDAVGCFASTRVKCHFE